MLLEMGWTGNAGLKILCGGEVLPADLGEQLRPCCGELWNMYGPTETTIWSSVYKVESGFVGTAPIGRPIANTTLYVLDAHQQPAPVGVPGELYIGGEGVARGYLNRPELTSEKFVADPFAGRLDARMYRTGDLARFLSDGNIQYLGRLDNQVKIRGFRIELGEIEAALAKHAGIQTAMVTAREDNPGDKRLVAYFVPTGDWEVSNDNLRGFLKQDLPDYMIPSAFVKMDALPLTPNGKINWRALPKPTEAGAAAVAPRDDIELRLLEIWRQVLGLESIGVTDNFFELGGHSLLAVRLLAEIQRATGKEIPLAALFRGATIEYLARVVGGSETVSHATLTEVQRGGSLPPFFAAVVPGVNALGYLALARHMDPERPLYELQGPGPKTRQRPYAPQEFTDMASEYIRAMRKVQPEGPYYLGGMCEGARIAFEMARLLESQGQKVNLLAIFDTWVIENSQNRLLWHFYLYSQWLRAWWRLPSLKKRRALSRALRSTIKSLFRMNMTERSEWPKAYWPENYVPQKCNGNITIFKRRKQPFYYVRDPLMGWGSRTTGQVEVHLVSVVHNLILREPYVQDLAAKLKRCLDRSYPSSGPARG